MSEQPFEHPVPAPGTVLDRPLSEVLGFSPEPGGSASLKRDFQMIREAEVKAEEASARIRLY